MEHLVRRGEVGAEAITTDLFVFSAALLLLYFLLRMIYRYAPDRPATTWYGKSAPAFVLVLAALPVIAAALAYVHYISPALILSKESSIGAPLDTDGAKSNPEATPTTTDVSQAQQMTRTIRGSETGLDVQPSGSEAQPTISPEEPLPTGQTVSVKSTPGLAHNLQTLSATSAVPSHLDTEVKLEQALRQKQNVTVLQVLFPWSSTEITPEFYSALNEISQSLVDDPQLRLDIRGHSDSRGFASANQQVSEERAKAVARYLTQRGVDKDRLRVMGYGSTRPVASNDTADRRAKNRRVEILVVR